MGVNEKGRSRKRAKERLRTMSSELGKWDIRVGTRAGMVGKGSSGRRSGSGIRERLGLVGTKRRKVGRV